MWDFSTIQNEMVSRQTSMGVTVAQRFVDGQFQVDFEIKTLEVLLAMLGPGLSPVISNIDQSEPLSVVMAALRVLRFQDQLGTVFVNPKYVIVAEKDCREFRRQVRGCRFGWLHWLKTFLGPHQLRREMRMPDVVFPEMLPRLEKLARVLMRQLKFTGVLIVEGKHQPREKTGKQEEAKAQPPLRSGQQKRIAAQQ